MSEDTNCGVGMYRDTPEEKEIERLTQQLSVERMARETAERKRDEYKNAAFHMHDGELVHSLRAKLAALEAQTTTPISASDEVSALREQLDWTKQTVTALEAQVRKEGTVAHDALTALVKTQGELEACRAHLFEARQMAEYGRTSAEMHVVREATRAAMQEGAQ